MDEILAEVERHPAAHVVLTGGEPMIAKELPELASRLRAMGKHITIETAGTVAPIGGRLRPGVREPEAAQFHAGGGNDSTRMDRAA